MEMSQRYLAAPGDLLSGNVSVRYGLSAGPFGLGLLGLPDDPIGIDLDDRRRRRLRDGRRLHVVTTAATTGGKAVSAAELTSFDAWLTTATSRINPTSATPNPTFA